MAPVICCFWSLSFGFGNSWERIWKGLSVVLTLCFARIILIGSEVPVM